MFQCKIPPQLNYDTVWKLHSDPVYFSIQLYIYTSPFSCVLKTIKANMQVLYLKDLTKNGKKNFLD